MALLLSQATYLPDSKEIQTTLQKLGWNLVWVANQDFDGNYAYVARSILDDTVYAVAIRGSEFDFNWDAFYNWFQQDLNVFEQVAWGYGNDANAMIAQGAADGLSNLQQLVCTTPSWSLSLLQYVLSQIADSSKTLHVVGHSLGGNLATVAAPWLVYEMKQAGKSLPAMSVYTYAAPASGNTYFANDFDQMFQDRSWRYVLDNDIVPTCPIFNLMFNMSYWYSPAPNATEIATLDGVSLQEALSAYATSIAASEVYYESVYQQTNTHGGFFTLKSTKCGNWTSNTLDDWFRTAACNHEVSSYLAALKKQESEVTVSKGPFLLS